MSASDNKRNDSGKLVESYYKGSAPDYTSDTNDMEAIYAKYHSPTLYGASNSFTSDGKGFNSAFNAKTGFARTTGIPGDDSVQGLIKGHAICNRLTEDWYTNFKRFGIIDPYNTMTNTKEYLFFTKPDLHLLTAANELNSELDTPFFADAFARYPNLFYQLQYSRSKLKGPLMPLLSNAVSSTLDLPSIEADSYDTAANLYGTKISYRGNSMHSDEDFSFSLEFEDTKYLEVYMLFKIFDEYERMKWLGMVTPPSEEYVRNRVLHDQISIYKYIVGEDGQSLIFWAKATGVYSLNVPRDALSDTANNSGTQKLTVNFKSQFVRDMDPRTLIEFNKICIDQINNTSYSDMPLYDRENQHMNGNWAKTPYVAYRTYTGSQTIKGAMQKYFLRWKG